MPAKAPTAKKKSSAKAAAPKVAAPKAKAPVKAKAKAKASWAETMKKALEKKQPAAGFPDQPKPRDSGVQPVRKNAY